jgi:serine protease
MPERTASVGLRWMAALVLAGSAIPMVRAWQAADRQATPEVVSATPPADPKWVSPTEIEVQLKDGEGDDVLADLGREAGAPLSWNSPMHAETEIARLTVPAGVSEDDLLAKLRADSRVSAADPVHYYAEPAGAALPDEEATETQAETVASAPAASGETGEDSGRWKPNDPRYGEQWNLQMVKAEEAWEVTRGKGVVVAVIDTGCTQARDFKQTSYVKGYNFSGRNSDPSDDNGHGTHVAGTIAESTDNNEGVAGLAFGASIMPLKVLSARGGGSSADIAEAVRWAADHGANVINMSLGGPFPDKLMASACTYAHDKGVTIVCAAGNEGKEGVSYPAGYKECIAVSAVGPKGDLSFYSSWGKKVAIAAPGGDAKVGGDAGKILQNTVLTDQNGGVQDDYFAFQGTSMATPHVAAVAALIEAAGVKKPDDVLCVLQKSAAKKGPANKYGAGILDAGKAAKLAANTYDDGITRFWMVVGLMGGCFLVGRAREKAGNRAGYPILSTAALSFGLLFPDWLTGFLGMSSHWNILAHSILVPGALLVMFAESRTERRFLGWMALGLALHLGWEFLRGTTPAGLDFGALALLPWVASNVAIGTGMLLAGLNTGRE